MSDIVRFGQRGNDIPRRPMMRIARREGLGKGHVCRYCRQAFRSWSDQLGLQALFELQVDGTCIMGVERLVAG